MRLPRLAMAPVEGARGGIVLGLDPCGVIARVRQAWVAGIPAERTFLAGLARAAGHGSHPARRSQAVVVPVREGLSGLTQQRGGDEISDPRHGANDLDVTMLVRVSLHIR